MHLDAHQHFWRYDPAEYGWIDETMGALRRDFLPPDAKREMDRAGFDASVAVQARQSRAETAFLLDLADAYPFIAGVVGWIDLQAPNVDDELEAIAGRRGLVGLRHIVQAEPDGFLARPAFRRGIAALERFDLPYDILIYARQLPAAIDVVAAFPRQRFVLDHLGKPDIRSGRFDAWRTEFSRLADYPNVWCKLSGLVTEADWQAWSPSQLRPYVETAFECYGPGRVMIGSDWPVCTLAATYQAAMAVVTGALGPLTTAEQDRVLGGTAREFWRL